MELDNSLDKKYKKWDAFDENDCMDEDDKKEYEKFEDLKRRHKNSEDNQGWTKEDFDTIHKKFPHYNQASVYCALMYTKGWDIDVIEYVMAELVKYCKSSLDYYEKLSNEYQQLQFKNTKKDAQGNEIQLTDEELKESLENFKKSLKNHEDVLKHVDSKIHDELCDKFFVGCLKRKNDQISDSVEDCKSFEELKTVDSEQPEKRKRLYPSKKIFPEKEQIDNLNDQSLADSEMKEIPLESLNSSLPFLECDETTHYFYP